MGTTAYSLSNTWVIRASVAITAGYIAYAIVLEMRRLQRDDQPDGRAHLQAPDEVNPYTLYIEPGFYAGFLFREVYGVSLAMARIWYLATSPSPGIAIPKVTITLFISSSRLSMKRWLSHILLI